MKKKLLFAITVISLSGAGALLPMSVHGATMAELQAQLTALLAQVAALQAQLASSGSTTSGTVPASLLSSGDLTLGSKGATVMDLQKYLNANGAQVAASGAGSPGNETSTFGSLTKAALAKWQAANGVSPATGYFGARTRAKLSAAGGTTTTTPASVLVSVPEEIITPVVATTVSADPVVILPNPFDSSLKIESILRSYTLSSYGEKILGEFRISADEPIGITRIRLKNTGTLYNVYIVGFKLINSATNEVLVKVENSADQYIDFKMTANEAKTDKGLAVSGKNYYITGIILTPSYGAEKPYIRLNIEAASDISAFDYNDLNRIANISKTNIFPIEGAKIVAF